MIRPVGRSLGEFPHRQAAEPRPASPANRFGSPRKRIRFAADRRRSRSRRPTRRPARIAPDQRGPGSDGRQAPPPAASGRRAWRRVSGRSTKSSCPWRDAGEGLSRRAAPWIVRATACAPRPAALITFAAVSRIASPPPVSIVSPSRSTCPETTGVANAIAAPCAAASPHSASMRAWLSTMPVEGERRARSALSSGSSARASSPVSQTRSATPFAFARVSSAARPATSLSLAATMSLPQRRCGTPYSQQKRYSISFPSTHRCVLVKPVG